jgi:hypothetical protein
LAAPKQLPLDCLFFFEQIVALADDIVAAESPAKAPLPGSRSQAILNLLPAQLKLACGEPCHLLSIDAQLIKANANKNVSFFFILGVAITSKR